MELELKRYIADFNYLVERLNKAENLSEEELKNYSDEKFLRLSNEVQKILKDASKVANKIEKLLGRPLTNYESLHGINI
ncbi:hypothetical protein [uncultured Clostridium sp.]|uniref:hypothetical protein n=1 Tax=uncultured Clostridium sp. TaxID=59620 RepID=UPI0025EE4C2D|nr:hypothetical protein [uncultured Clostridium sp.]